MHILIVGAGLGGLSAALCFARQKHQVTLLERRQALTAQGGGLNIRPGASKIMHTWGLRHELEQISDATSSFLLRNAVTGEITMSNILTDVSEEIDWGTEREHLMRLLYRAVVQAGVQVQFGIGVADVWDSQIDASLTTEDGRQLTADLILAADGIRSRIRSKILADTTSPIDPIVDEVTLYGVKVDAEKVKARDDTKRLVDDQHVHVWQGRDLFVVSRLRTKLGYFGGLFGIKSDNDMKGLWDEKGDIQYVRNSYAGTCEDLRAVLEMADSCNRWKQAELPNLPRWTSKQGRILLLGDSAHAMHPNAAQGFSMIIEDIGVLDYLLQTSSNATAKMPSIAETWQNVRKPRVERIKAYARENSDAFVGKPLKHRHREDNIVTKSVKSLKNVQPKMDAKFTTAAFVKWTMDYDVGEEVKKYQSQQGQMKAHL